MNIEAIIRAWKSDDQALESPLPVSPVGEELNEEELLEVSGGCVMSCGGGDTCAWTCSFTVLDA
jgi:hypothetical protein